MPDQDDQHSADALSLDFDALAAATVAERGEVWLLQWLETAEKTVEHLEEDLLQAAEARLGSNLVRLLSTHPPSSQAAPKPGRPIRNIAARVLVKLLQRVDQRSLYDIVKGLLKVCGTDNVKNGPEMKEYRVASFYVVAELMKAHGLSIMSQFADCITQSLRVAKSTSNPPILRYYALHCLNSALCIGGRTLATSDSQAKDLLRTLRNLLADKTNVVVRATVDCYLTLLENTELIRGLADIEALFNAGVKALENSDPPTQSSLAKLLATLLASTQIAGSAILSMSPTGSKSKKPKEGQDDDDEDDPYPMTMTAEDKGKTLLKPEEMLNLWSNAYHRSPASRKIRTGLIHVYADLLTALKSTWTEQNYPEILRHIIADIATPKQVLATISHLVVRYDTLIGRKLANIILRDVIGTRLLTEQGQVVAIREITSTILSQWPSLLPNRTAPGKHSLLIALDEVSGLLRGLGSATPPVQDVLYDPLIRLLAHPSHSVQVSAALCLRTFCTSAPTRLPGTTSHVLELVNKDLAQLGQPTAPSDIAKRAVGHAFGLAGLMSVVSARPLYVSFDVSAKVMSLAIQLLKQSGNHDLPVSAVEIQVAWVLVGSLMTLGPNFVKVHLPQLLILWKNALPKASAKDTSASQIRTENEWGFLLHVRECTLSAMLSFLRYNSPLVTLDVGRRIVAMLSNGLAFLNDFAVRHAQLLQEQIPSTTSTLRLVDRDLMMRRRLLQCFVALGQHPAVEPLQTNLLTFCLSIIADPERYTGSVVQAAIAAVSGTFTSVWESHDGLSYGVTSLLTEVDVDAYSEPSDTDDSVATNDWLNRDLVDVSIDTILYQSSVESSEHDSMIVSTPAWGTGEESVVRSPPPSTGTVDAAIQLFATYLPVATASSQSSILQQLGACIKSSKVEKNPGRRMAILVNAVTALTRSLRNQSASRRIHETTILNLERDIVAGALAHSDGRVRSCAAEAFGRLGAIAGSTFMAAQTQYCVGQIVNNTDPESRVGHSLALGQIYGQVGSMSGGPVLKTIVDVLMSLSSDPHPLVHFWALRSLSGVIATAGLTYEPFLSGTLGMVTRLYCSDTHEPEGGSMGSVNIRGELPAYQNFSKILDAITGVLGPELQSSRKVSSIIKLLVTELSVEPGDGIKVEAFRSLQHFMMFAIDSVDLPSTINVLGLQLKSPRRPLRVAAINSIYQLVQRNAQLMSKIGGDKLVVGLFSLLDDDSTIEGVRAAIQSWLRQTADANPSGWLDLCQRIVSRATAAQTKITVQSQSNGGAILLDEESQGLGLDSNDGSNQSIRSTSRWRTQLFALQCVHDIFLAVKRADRREHFDVRVAKAKGFTNVKPLLLSRVSDLIKMAFTASTASIMEIRLEGLTVLRDVVESFRASPDVDFEEALLLEQFQAPIAAALTPAFAADSYPEVLASAIQVCAIFIGSGVVREISKMGRILKLLSTALESCREAEILSIGDMKDLSSTASVMIKTSVFAAWAEFQIASMDQPYLGDVIRPHLTLLCSCWIASLREYARLSTDSESTPVAGAPSSLDSLHTSLIKDVAVNYYATTWLAMLKATALLLKNNNSIMLKAIDGQDPTSPTTNGNHDATSPSSSTVNPKVPALYWPILFGLAYEGAATSAASSDDPASTAGHTMETALLGLQALSQRDVAGDAVLQEPVLNEVCNLCYRLASTEPARIQINVVRVILQLVANITNPLEFVNQTTQCLRVLVQILRNAIPGLSSTAARDARRSPTQHAALLNVGFVACAELADRVGSQLRDHVYGLVLSLYGYLLQDETSGVDLVAPTLPALKTLIERGFAKRNLKDDLLPRVLHGFISLALQNAEEVRGRQGHSAALKTRNNVLASVLMLSNIPKETSPSRAALEHCCFLISHLMESTDLETLATAIHCVKSLTTTAGPHSYVAVSQLLPSLIVYLATVASISEPTAPQVALVVEASKVLSNVVTLAVPAQRQQALVVVLPVCILLLNSESNPINRAITTQILQLAGIDAGAFREAIASLKPDDKSTLETALRGTVQKQSTLSNKGVAPTIALKSFG